MFFNDELVFLLGFFGGGDGFAERTGVVAVECPCHGVAQGVGLKVAGEHGRPGDGLQQGPVRAEGGHEREDDEDFAEPDKHKGRLVEAVGMSIKEDRGRV